MPLAQLYLSSPFGLVAGTTVIPPEQSLAIAFV
jgi:hypothetical protein